MRMARAGILSPVHRRVPVVRLDLWRPAEDGGGAGSDGDGGVVEHLLWIVSHQGAATLASLPLLQRKLDVVLEREDIIPGSYDEQHLVQLFGAMPEDDLLTLDIDTLQALVGEMLANERDQTVGVTLRPVVGSHTVTALVTMPVERWTRALRQRLERFLSAQLDGDRVDVTLSIGGSTSTVTARFLVHVAADAAIPDDLDEVAREVRLVCRSWEEELVAELRDRRDDVAPDAVGDPAPLAARWTSRLPESYRDAVPARDAVRDVVELAALDVVRGEGEAPEDGDAERRLRVWFGARRSPERPERLCLAADHEIELSDLLPALESLGLWVTDEARWPAGGGLSLHHLGVRIDLAAVAGAATGHPAGGPEPGEGGGGPDRRLADPDVAARLAEAIRALVVGPAEVDGLNRLVLHAGLDWREVGVLRTYRRYRHQVDSRVDQRYVDDVLVGHPAIARALVELWWARATPDDDAGARSERAERASAVVRGLCDDLPRLDHDRILRGIGGTIDATLRTSWAVRPDGPLALKLDPSLVPGAPHPRPHREVFVCGPTVEGVHLRAGPVARGGLRASDRDQDYRSEVLDLMRAQVLKNAVIVPTGAKGGFVVRETARGSDGLDRRERVARAYDAFVGAVLDVTDDYAGDAVVPVPGRWDGDDPYLVVAADKGTAAFSDRANAIAESRGFWLGDAFASGGSHGYDHKALGITARGAWVAIGNHLRALGIDERDDLVTVAGVGDMSGDVFGNGMLHSDRLRLVAAFDHRHVFLDPDPDPEASYAERRRLFELPGSSWDDYDRSLLSPGGGVHPRSAKAVPLTDEVRASLRVDADELTPAALVRAVLEAPVDLLYFGGIGTYVRASSEEDAAVDDRANAEVRVEGRDVRARIVGEGANLALTQRARIEVARRGARINVDAIDNSAGVDSSDHEVNLKILLARAEDAGRIDRAERDALLAANADEVVAAVLADCQAQSDALDRAERQATAGFPAVARVLRRLVADGVLDPEVEALPDDKEIEARSAAGAGFTRPELAVLLAGVKRQVVGELLASDVPELPVLRDALVGYFPPALAASFDDLLDGHRLRRELVASEVANDVVDHLGLTAVVALVEELGAGVADVAAAYWVARSVVRAPGRWDALAGAHRSGLAVLETDPVDAGDLLAALLYSLTRTELLRRRSASQRGDTWDPASRIAEDLPVADAVVAFLDEEADAGLDRERQHLTSRLVASGLDPAVAVSAAEVVALDVVPDVAAVARILERDPIDVLLALRAADDRLGLDGLRRRAVAVSAEGEWARVARQGLLDDLVGIRREVARAALADAMTASAGPDDEGGAALGRGWRSTSAAAVDAYLGRNPLARTEADGIRRRVLADDRAGLDGVAVAVRALRRAAF